MSNVFVGCITLAINRFKDDGLVGLQARAVRGAAMARSVKTCSSPCSARQPADASRSSIAEAPLTLSFAAKLDVDMLNGTGSDRAAPAKLYGH